MLECTSCSLQCSVCSSWVSLSYIYCTMSSSSECTISIPPLSCTCSINDDKWPIPTRRGSVSWAGLMSVVNILKLG